MGTNLNEKLDNLANIFLSLKCFLLSSDELIIKVKKHLEECGKTVIILDSNDIFNSITKALDYDFLLYKGDCAQLNPLCVVIDNYDTSLIKGFIDTYYYTHDNVLENTIIKRARYINSNYTKIKTDEDLFKAIDCYWR